jgi:gamma-glutamyl-gamma-aminobutyrate hydrolase PuuD
MPAKPEATTPLIAVIVADAAATHDPALTLRKSELYADGVRRHGGKPALISVATSPAERDRILGGMDGLLLSGGPDIDPALYHEAVTGAVEVDAARDTLDQLAWHEAERRSVPVFGICRGFQAVNVFSGGSLLQDLPDHAGVPYGAGPAHTHNLEIDGESRFGRALAEGSEEGLATEDEGDDTAELTVNTFHHQAVDHTRLAPGLKAVGWAASHEGRILEALESTGGRWVVAVQCHPERTDSTRDEFEGVWEAFVRAARETSAAPEA